MHCPSPCQCALIPEAAQPPDEARDRHAQQHLDDMPLVGVAVVFQRPIELLQQLPARGQA